MLIPATTSNLGPGFDVLGMALDLRNEITLEVLPEPGPAAVEISGEGGGFLPKDERNLVLRSLRTLLPRSRWPNALRLRLDNRIPIARGLGSSAAARLGGLLAAAAALQGPAFRRESLLERACILEGHPDNAVPACLGGLYAAVREGTSVRGGHQLCRIRPPEGLRAVICVPDFRLETARARAVLPGRPPMRDVVRNLGRLALLICAFEQRRYGLLRIAMRDFLHQPHRRRLVPGLERVLQAALAAGAFGSALSGAGPAILAFSPAGAAAGRVGRAMEAAFGRHGIASRSLVLGIDRAGARVERP